MPEFTVTREIDAPVDVVWSVLNDFGDIQRWSPGVTKSRLTSSGPVSLGSTRYCEFAPMGAVNERIDLYKPRERLTITLYETFKLPITGAVADFTLETRGEMTKVTLSYRYTPNLMGRILSGTVNRQMRKGMDGLFAGLERECRRVAAS